MGEMSEATEYSMQIHYSRIYKKVSIYTAGFRLVDHSFFKKGVDAYVLYMLRYSFQIY
ncbi:hypothetical protein C8P63_11822 [Melghirimyces profundicolus]|uniref:Uncharacterized protein n=1 Tax=Melghirimyces profundicolus TaxID=1242148 RepID=A0A2T6BPZ2_9BACL|nr:hypothetical protein C8P63_11822 [Melghirimyces profundicolus]